MLCKYIFRGCRKISYKEIKLHQWVVRPIPIQSPQLELDEFPGVWCNSSVVKDVYKYFY